MIEVADLQRLAQDAATAGLPRPVFIGGSSRSGTTLLGAMLGAGSELLTVPEARFKWRLLDLVPPDGTDMALADAVERLRADWKFAHWRVTIEGTAAAAGTVPYGALLRRLAREHGRVMNKPEAGVWFDHTPGNVRVARSLQRLFPDAKFVHLVRDGRAVAASCMPLDWGPNDIHEAARYWSSSVGVTLAATQYLGPQRARLVRYEDLVTQPEATLRELCQFLGVPFAVQMLTPSEYTVLPYTADQHRLVGKTVDATRVAGWKERLSDRQVEIFEYVTGELLGFLGYDLEYGVRARRPNPAGHALDITRSTLRRKVGDPLRRQVRRRRGAGRADTTNRSQTAVERQQ